MNDMPLALRFEHNILLYIFVHWNTKINMVQKIFHHKLENPVTLTTYFRFELTRKSVDNQLVSLVSADRIKVVRPTGFSSLSPHLIGFFSPQVNRNILQ